MSSSTDNPQGLGRDKTRLSNLGIVSVKQLADASESVLQQLESTVAKKETFRKALADARQIMAFFQHSDASPANRHDH